MRSARQCPDNGPYTASHCPAGVPHKILIAFYRCFRSRPMREARCLAAAAANNGLKPPTETLNGNSFLSRPPTYPRHTVSPFDLSSLPPLPPFLFLHIQLPPPICAPWSPPSLPLLSLASCEIRLSCIQKLRGRSRVLLQLLWGPCSSVAPRSSSFFSRRA